jgi:K+-sensing histidine kinase KdpD
MSLPGRSEKSLAAALIAGGTVDAARIDMTAIISSSPPSHAFPIRRPTLRLVSGPSDHAATEAPRESAKTAVIACLCADSPFNNELLRKASAAAVERDGELYAVLLDSPRTRYTRSQLRTLIDAATLAACSGAKIVWLDSTDMVADLLRFARHSRVSRIFVARNRPTLFARLFRRTAYSHLLRHADGFRIDVVGFESRPDYQSERRRSARMLESRHFGPTLR